MTNPVADELEIRHLVAAYADAVNRRDAALWASTWAEDGVWALPGNEVSGRDAVVGMWTAAMGSFEFVAQLVYQGTLEISGDEATGRWYLTEHLRGVGDESGRFTVGTYKDEYRKVHGRWCFSKRVYQVLYADTGPGVMTGKIAAVE